MTKKPRASMLQLAMTESRLGAADLPRERRVGQDLQRYSPPERLLLGFVDHAHAASADLPDDAVVA